MRGVPLARRNLFQDRRRAVLAVGGVAVALLLVLVLDGVRAGAMRQVTAYLRNLPADVVVSQRGVRTMHMSSSALPEDSADLIARVDGVAWAESIRFTTGTVRAATGRQLSYVIGYDPQTARGGPWELAEGRPPGPAGVVLDAVAADQMHVAIGDPVVLLGRRFTITGISRGGTSITNTLAFVRTADFAAARGPAVSYVLVGARPGVAADDLARRVAAAVPGTTAQTRSEMVGQEGSLVRDMSADVMQIMTVIAFFIALAVVALTLFTATLSKLREYAIVKALGARSFRLSGTVLAQAAWASTIALAVGVALTFAVAGLVSVATPNVRLAVELGAVVRVGVSAFGASFLGALVPLRRLARLDPATAFRS